MVWCNHCDDDCPTERDPDKGYICCVSCGKILDQDIYFSGPTFEKTGSGQSRLAGSILHSVQSGYSASRERTIMKGRDEIRDIVNHLRVGGGDSIINKAHAFYQIALDKNFTRGRRTSHVAAACLYIACRQMKKAYLLIDFSDYLQTNVYVLGAVFLQLCKVLSLDNHPFVQKLVDPSLFIHRFTESLLGRKNNTVSETALRIVASMKRNWMQTGRKPSGLCGAALYISALSHGLSYSKSDIVTVVHICEATLTKRLVEFENTESGCLTIEEFLTTADELDGESHSTQLPKPGEVLCKHKDTKEPHFAHGLCQKCYNKFIKISGGLQGGADPPAFQLAEKQRVEKAKAEEKMRLSSLDTEPCDLEHGLLHDMREAEFSSKVSSAPIGLLTFEGHESTAEGAEHTGHQDVDTSACNTAVGEEEESLSDIDDVEVDGYLHNEEEKRYKTIIWEVMNREYIEEQAAKEAAAAAKEAQGANGSDATKSRKERKRRCSDSTPAKTPAEATSNMLKMKGFSSKVNYEALGALFPDQDSVKKQKTESDAGDAEDADGQQDDIEENDNAFDSGGGQDGDEAYTYEDSDYAGDDNGDYYGNRDEEYVYDEEYE